MRSSKYMSWLSLTVTLDMRDKIDKLSLDGEISVSEATRRVLEKGLEAF